MPDKIITGTDAANVLDASKSVDTITGGKGADTFQFDFSLLKPKGDNTLNPGDTITDYEYGEIISITGHHFTAANTFVQYEKSLDVTILGLDVDADGKFDISVTLDGDRSGDVITQTNCCGAPTTEIRIVKPKAAAKEADKKADLVPKLYSHDPDTEEMSAFNEEASPLIYDELFARAENTFRYDDELNSGGQVEVLGMSEYDHGNLDLVY